MSSYFVLRQTLGRVGVQRLATVNNGKACLTEAWRHVAASSAPRSTSSSSSSLSLSLSSFPKSMMFHSTAFRAKEDGKDYKDALTDLLTREYDEEIMNKTNIMPDDLIELKSDLERAGWKIADNAAMTKMVRTTEGGLKVQIAFHCQDMVESMDEDENQTMDEEEASMPFRFTVIASKAGQTILFGCMSENAGVTLQSVAITSSDDDATLLNSGTVPNTDYQGPDFTELAEDVQYGFQDYMEFELGVNGDVAAFIAMYADYREQAGYVDFLKRAKQLLK